MGQAPPVVPAGRVESEIARDLARRGLLASPLVVGVAFAVRGVDGATGAVIALAIVLANFGFAAAAQARAAGRSPAVLGAVLVGGYVARLAVVTVALLLFRHVSWVDFPAFGITLACTHLGLLAWEARSVSLTLAFPGLKPTRAALGAKD